MTLKTESFENFPNGTTFSAANATAFGDASGSYANVASNANTFVTTTADAAHGTSCLDITGVSATAGQFDITDTAAADGVLALYLKMTSTPSLTAQFPVIARQSGGALGRLEMNSSRQVRLNGWPGAGTFGTALALSTWYRIELIVTGTGTASTAVTANIYVGDNTGTPFATDSVSGQTTAAQLDRFRFYRASNEATAISCRIDSIRQNIGSATPLGPWPSNPGINQLGYRSLWSPAAAIQAATR